MSHYNFDDRCLCGHEFGDHMHRAPHRCPEMATSGKHRCTCRAFVLCADRSRPANVERSGFDSN